MQFIPKMTLYNECSFVKLLSKQLRRKMRSLAVSVGVANDMSSSFTDICSIVC